MPDISPDRPKYVSTTHALASSLPVLPESPTSATSEHLAAEREDELRLSRTPTPYQYHSGSKSLKQPLLVLPVADSTPLPSVDASSNSPLTHSDSDRALSPHSRRHVNGTLDRKRSGRSSRRGSTQDHAGSPSPSGTEADDEGHGYTKALPPAPLRPHKGLKDGGRRTASGASTPGSSMAEYFSSRRGSLDERGPGGGAARVPRLSQKRRAELVRRMVELCLIIAVGYLQLLRPYSLEILRRSQRELIAFFVVLAVLTTIYPFRLIYDISARRPRGSRKAMEYLRVPASFDPAPLLYPTLLPLITTISSLPGAESAILQNIVLGLASLPPTAIPLHGTSHGYSVAHWLISILPLAFSEYTRWPSRRHPSPPLLIRTPMEGLSSEDIASLFALHQALLSPLHYVTSTSLLPAELHLLSAALINLLFFAQTPQGIVLRDILWIGGLGMFIFCGPVIRWGIALARIPRWRLRRAQRVFTARETFVSSLQQAVLDRQASDRSKRVHNAESDADEDGYPVQPQSQHSSTRAASLSKEEASAAFSAEERRPNGHSGERNEHLDALDRTRKRSQTLPDMLKSPINVSEPKVQRRPSRRRSTLKGFLSLTPEEALQRKWTYAAWVYLMCILIVILPLRESISRFALRGHEPIGWAIGYLFADVELLREYVLKWSLESWIPLPSRFRPDCGSAGLGIASRLRFQVFGVANTRLIISAWYVGVLVTGLAIVLRLSTTVEVDTRRKVFHGMMVAMLLPTIPVDPAFIALALSIILAVFLLLDVLRASQLPPLSKPIAYFLTPYVDGRDLRGPVVVSHIFLLIGCAIPLWLSLAVLDRTGEAPWSRWEVPSRDVSMVAGVVCVGMGDAAASLIGRRYGRRKWLWPGGKSIEGSLAFAVAVTAGLLFAKAWLRTGGWEAAPAAATLKAWAGTLGKAVFCACGASLTEAVLTGCNDNVVVPVMLWLLVRGTGL